MDSGTVTALVAITMVAGLVGTLLPFLPGLVLILVAAILYGLSEGFGGIGSVAMVVIVGLFVVGSLVSLVFARRSAARGGAPTTSMLVAAVGGVVGMFVIPFFGFVPGAIVGLVLAERSRLGQWSAAWRVTLHAAKGYLLGMLVEAACGAAMFATWAIWALND
ncbi:MAG: DUF456 domain-containing protein [Mycobacteriales bacterium]